MAASHSKVLNSATASRRRRVALLIHSLQGGGAERVMSQLANRWSAEHEVHLITWSKADTDRYPLDPLVFRYGLDLQVPSRGLFGGIVANVRRVRQLRNVLQQVKPEIVLSFCDQMNIVNLEAMRAMPQIPVWIAEHSDPEKQRLSSMWEAWRRRNYPRCTGCVALTDSIALFMSRWMPQDRLRVIPAVIQTNSATPPCYKSAADSGLNSVLFVGRLSQEKRVDLLLEAWKLVEPRLANWQLLIVGDGPMRASLEAEVILSNRHSVQPLKRVQFLGWQDHPEQIMATSQIFVLCSRYEGFPVALLEALYYGLPAIATHCSSAIDQLQSTTSVTQPSDSPHQPEPTQPTNQSKALEIIPLESVEKLAEAIVELAKDTQRRQRMSQAAQRVAKNFTWDAIGPLWDSVLE
jgi:GalNAc-alpha-(1->4)-GalNAc-alpha-(1->3)-diNAcBac-PP-undecaprenol alpha-1,4-N-acetyl-D-galactosaminyltransferase